MASELSYCAQVVKQHDPDRYLIGMFAPHVCRADLWALFAFNYEIAKTREVVSETQLGLIRLQWWRDAIEGIYERDDVLEHEGLKALAAAIKRHGLEREDFETLIYAREFDLEDVLPGNVEGLLNYANFTASPLLKMAVQVSGGNVDIEPVQPVAVNFALAGILRAVVFHAGQRRCLLPEDLLKGAGQRMDHLYEGKVVDGLPGVVKQVADHAVLGVRCENVVLKKTYRLAGIYLKQLKHQGYDVFSPKMAVPPAFKALRLAF